MAQQMAVPDNQVISYADALGKVSPLLFGSGKTTTDESETGSVSPGSQAASDALLAQILPQVTGTAATDPVVANILAKAQEAFAPAIGAQTASGLYNSTTLQSLRDQATARATGEASTAVLQHQTQAADIAQRTIAANEAATRTQTGAKTAQTGSILSPQMLASLGTTIFGKSALNYAKKQLGFDDAADVKDLGNGSISSTVDSSGAAANDVGFDAFGNPTSGSFSGGGGGGAGGSVADASTGDVGGTVSSDAVASSLSADGVGVDAVGGASSLEATTAAADLGDGAIASTVDSSGAALGDVGFDAFGDSTAVDLGGEAGADIAGGVAADAGADAAVGAGVEVAADAGAAEGLGDAAIAIAAWIICTELQRQGRLSTKLYYRTGSVFANYCPIGKRGYYIWAIPCVKHLRKHPDSKFSKVLEVIFNARVKHIAAGLGIKGGQRTVLGFIATHGLYTGCWVLGRLLWLLSINPTPAEVTNRG